METWNQLIVVVAGVHLGSLEKMGAVELDLNDMMKIPRRP